MLKASKLYRALVDLKHSEIVYPDKAFKKLDGLSDLPKAAVADLKALDGENRFEVFKADVDGKKKYFAIVRPKDEPGFGSFRAYNKDGKLRAELPNQALWED